MCPAKLVVTCHYPAMQHSVFTSTLSSLTLTSANRHTRTCSFFTPCQSNKSSIYVPTKQRVVPTLQ